MTFTSRYFHVGEFACHDGTPYPETWLDRLNALCSVLDVIRGDWGGPLMVISGYRTDEWNTRIGGAKASQHCEGRAADFRPLVASAVLGDCVADLWARIQRLLSANSLSLLGGMGNYPGKWIHVDIRPRPADGHIARWEGAGIGSEMA